MSSEFDIKSLVESTVKKVLDTKKEHYERFKKCDYAKNIRFNEFISVVNLTKIKFLCEKIVVNILNKEILVEFGADCHEIYVEHYSKYMKLGEYKIGVFYKLLSESECIFDEEIILFSGATPLFLNGVKHLFTQTIITLTMDYLRGFVSFIIVSIKIRKKKDYCDILGLLRNRCELEKTIDKRLSKMLLQCSEDGKTMFMRK